MNGKATASDGAGWWRLPVGTAAFVLLPSLIMFALFAGDPDGKWDHLLRADSGIFAGQVWRLLSYTLVHGSWFHALGVCFPLVIFQWCAARCFPLRWLVANYLLSAATAALVVVALSPDGNLIGGSPVVLATLGMCVSAAFRARSLDVENPVPVPPVLMVCLVLLSFAEDMMNPVASLTAHLCGLVVGLIMGKLAPMPLLAASRTEDPSAVPPKHPRR